MTETDQAAERLGMIGRATRPAITARRFAFERCHTHSIVPGSTPRPRRFEVIELVFLICLSTAPEDCRTEHLLFTDIPVMTCMNGAPAQLAMWSAGHPDWQIKRWSCVRPDPTSSDI